MAEPFAPASPADLLRTLQTRFGHASFRPGQAEAIGALLTGRDALVVMPTGAGKSLVYQLASLHLPGTTLVISPLIALMQDQVASLDRRQIRATYVNSALPVAEQQERLERMARGAYSLMYITPERLRSAPFLAAVAHTAVSLLAVDEAHCISQWGHDFRPEYSRLGEAARQLGRPPIVSVTATATARVQDDISMSLGLQSPCRVVTGIDRPNVRYVVYSVASLRDKLTVLAERLRVHGADNPGRAAIIYAGTRAHAELVAAMAEEICGLGAVHYHAGLDAATRKAHQERFLAGDINVIAATNAFGMGIDRQDVGLVAHLALPASLEAYCQESGRAGRDGGPSEALLLYQPDDLKLQEFFNAQDRLTLSQLSALQRAIQHRTRAGTARLTLEDLSGECQQPQTSIRLGLDILEQAGAITRAGDYGATLFVQPGPWQDAAVAEALGHQDAVRANRQRLLRAMVHYAESDGCRR